MFSTRKFLAAALLSGAFAVTAVPAFAEEAAKPAEAAAPKAEKATKKHTKKHAKKDKAAEAK